MEKYLFALIAMLGLVITVSAVTVDGYCFLQNAQDHSGTKVLFTGITPGTLDDSTYTEINGYYLAELEGGFYDVAFSHLDYLNAVLDEQNCFNSVTLPELTLEYVGPYTEISGSLSGTLDAGNYHVVGDIAVEYTDSLIIEAGSVLYFCGDYLFDIQGYLQAAGTETDSIKFIPLNDEITWGGIDLFGAYNSLFDYCLITGSNDSGIYCGVSSNPTISNSTITGNYDNDSGGGISCFLASATIVNCNISDNSTGGDGGGINASHSTLTIINSAITGNFSDYYGSGAAVNCNFSVLTLNRCTISGNSARTETGGINIVSSEAMITNCTISGNSIFSPSHDYGAITVFECSPIIVNCIISANINSSGIYLYNSLETSIVFSDFFGNDSGAFGGELPSLWGELVTTNANDDSCDAFFNIFLDPTMVDPENGDFHLQEDSPCIDAGDPDSPLDPDGTIADIGAFYFNGHRQDVAAAAAGPVPFEFAIVDVYPNPFNAQMTINVALPQASRLRVEVNNINGRRITRLTDGVYGAGYHRFIFDAAGLSSGIYFIHATIPGKMNEIRKVILMK